MRVHWIVLLVVMVAVCLAGGPAFSEEAPVIETATGPAGLLEVEQQGKITVRALRAWNRLPDVYLNLARQLRQEAGLDLLGADLVMVRSWLGRAETGDPALGPHAEELQGLARFMDQGGHLDWAPTPAGSRVTAGALMRAGGKRWTQAEAGPATIPGSSAEAESVQTVSVQAPPVQAGGADAATLPPPVASSGSGPEDGVEFPLNDQVPGTYRVKLRVDGLTRVRPEDEPYFQRRLPRLLPSDPGVHAGELRFFEKISDYASVKPAFEGSASHDLVLGVATLDTPVSIKVDAPDNPGIPLTEKEIAGNVSYRVAGKSVYVYRHDEAGGDADIGFEESRDGEIRWTPRAASDTGRPVGPRALGVYMSYRIKKYVGDHELGTLGTSQHRIGWVVVAMPGDVYEHEGTLHAVGRAEPLTASGAAARPTAPEHFDFELPPYAVDKMAVALSEDLRHVAWVDGKEEGQKRVVVGGVPGQWYDDVSIYSMLFTPKGEGFRFEATLGDKEIPIYNGAVGPVFDDLVFQKMSVDGAHVLVAGKVGGLYRVFLDGRQVRETPFSVDDGVVVESGQAAWVEQGQDQHNGVKFAMVVTADGATGRRYADIVGAPQLSQSPAELYYVAEKEGGDRFLVRGQEELQPALASGKFWVNTAGSGHAFIAKVTENKKAVVVNGRTDPAFDTLWDLPTFSADGARYIYEGGNEGRRMLVVDGHIVEHGLGDPKSILAETFSPDGQRWAAGFQLNDEEYVVVVDGKEIGRGQGSPRRIVFSPDGTRVAWIENNKKSSRVCLDGQTGPEAREIYDAEPPQFSPDGRHLVYFTLDADKKTHLVVFGGQERVHAIIPPRVAFVDGGLEYLAIDGTHFRRETMALE